VSEFNSARPCVSQLGRHVGQPHIIAIHLDDVWDRMSR
jgi:hypothetical protein